jgi:hypothetical protein
VSYNDPDRPPDKPLTKEEVVAWYMSAGVSREVAEWHWERLPKPAYSHDLEE